MQKIVINKCYGGFSLSYKGVMKYGELIGITIHAWIDENTLEHFPHTTVETAMFVHYSTVPKEEYDKFSEKWGATPIGDRAKLGNGGYFNARDIGRDDPSLIEVVQLLGEDASGHCADLKIIEIPDNVEWEIEEYDGNEWISEKHRTWC